MEYENYLKKEVDVIIDRPIGSKHPKYGYIYPINYGFIPNTKAGDNEEIDVYIIDSKEPLKRARVKIIAIAKRLDDNEDKLIAVVDFNLKYKKEQIYKKIEFQERFFNTILLQ